MTYCVGMKLKSGIVAMADTRITSGTETTTAKKIAVHQDDKHSFFIMTSGLRSVRDKAVTYFQEVMAEKEFNKIYKAVNAFGEQLRKVAEEDRKALEKAGLSFNLFSIVGGQCIDDEEPKLFLLYPEGNWVEVGHSTPFVIIGNSGFGKPILNRTLKYDSDMNMAMKLGFLSFDSTRVSANDVDFPLDVILYKTDSFKLVEHRFEKADLATISEIWGRELQAALSHVPEAWMDVALNKLPS
ncbi:MAG: proteasome-type protease [Cytophagaceae bacterium]|nr:proteasome-type protease [Cytophagaceae bacterium]